MRRDTAEFLAAFAVGSVLGAGAAVLLRSTGNGARVRLGRRVREGLEETADAAGEVSDEAASLGRELVRALGAEIRRAIARDSD